MRWGVTFFEQAIYALEDNEVFRLREVAGLRFVNLEALWIDELLVLHIRRQACHAELLHEQAAAFGKAQLGEEGEKRVVVHSGECASTAVAKEESLSRVAMV